MKRGRDFLRKKAQVTVFIIIGLILLLTVGTIVYLQYAFKKAPSFELSTDPVTAYVQQCLVDVAEEAIKGVGQTGGFLLQEPLNEEEQKVTELLPFSSDVFLLANGKQQLQYWYYQKNDGIDRVAIPELLKQETGDGSIQDQIEQYVTEHLGDCLNNFEGLKKQGIAVTAAGEFSAATTITDQSVDVTAHLPLDITKEGAITRQDAFSAVVPVGLKPTYDLARAIAEHELNTLFLEQTTRNLLSIYGQVDKNYLPPIAGGLHFDPCAERVYWFYSDAQSNVKQMLAANIPYLNVGNTEFGKITVTKAMEADDEQRELRQAVFDKFTIFPTKTNYEGITAQFKYQTNYPLDLVFGNNVGFGIIQPNTFEINALVANFCMFEYSYLYNIKYPVIVTLTDTTSSFDGNPFIFQFPIEVVIKNNYPRIKLNDVLRNQYNIPEAAEEPSYQCTPKQRLSDPSTITVTDAKGAPVEEAMVSFQCGPSYVYDYDENGTVSAVHRFADTCFMGTTDEKGELTAAFPPCIGAGVLTIKQPDYVEKSAATGDILQGKSFAKTVILDKVYGREIRVEKYFAATPSETNEEGIGIHLDEKGNIAACNLNIEPKELFPYESAIISLTKLDTQNGVLSSVPVVVYETVTGESTAIDIAPGEYYGDIMLLREERYPGEMTVQANSERIEVSKTIGTETITYPEEDVLVPQAFTGGSVFYWNVTTTDLESGNTVVFSVIDEGAPETIEQVSAPLAHREGCYQLVSGILAPRFE